MNISDNHTICEKTFASLANLVASAKKVSSTLPRCGIEAHVSLPGTVVCLKPHFFIPQSTVVQDLWISHKQSVMLNIDLSGVTTAASQSYLPFHLPPQMFYFANCNALKGPTDTRMPEGFHPLGSCSFLILTSSCLSIEAFTACRVPSYRSHYSTLHRI